MLGKSKTVFLRAAAALMGVTGIACTLSGQMPQFDFNALFMSPPGILTITSWAHVFCMYAFTVYGFFGPSGFTILPAVARRLGLNAAAPAEHTNKSDS
jgi:hypothetical protein